MVNSGHELSIRLLEFWCHAHGYALRSFNGDIAVIDHGFGDTVWTPEDLAAAVARSLRTADDASALRRLSLVTHEIRHNPNCPRSYEVRTTGRDGVIDHKRPGQTLNDVGYGTTLAEAVTDIERTGKSAHPLRPGASRQAMAWHS